MKIFPVQLFNPNQVRVSVRQRVLSGGESLAGDETVIATDGGGRIEVTYSGIQLHDKQQARVWNAWLGYLAGGITECLVPLVSLATAPRGYTGKFPAKASGLFIDNEEWPEVMRYSNPLIAAHVGANAALRATTLNVVVDKGVTPKGGEWLSMGERAYKVIRPLGGGNFAIEPPLREAVTEDDPIIFDWPMVKAKQVVGSDPAAILERGRIGETEITFVESV